MLELCLLGNGDDILQLADFFFHVKGHCLKSILNTVFDIKFRQILLGKRSQFGILGFQDFKPSFKALTNCCCTACHHALHDDQQENQAHVFLTIPERLVIGLRNVGRDHLIELSLISMPFVPGQLDQMCDAVLKQQISIVVYGFSLFRTNQERSDLLLDHRFRIWKGILVE